MPVHSCRWIILLRSCSRKQKAAGSLHATGYRFFSSLSSTHARVSSSSSSFSSSSSLLLLRLTIILVFFFRAARLCRILHWARCSMILNFKVKISFFFFWNCVLLVAKVKRCQGIIGWNLIVLLENGKIHVRANSDFMFLDAWITNNFMLVLSFDYLDSH